MTSSIDATVARLLGQVDDAVQQSILESERLMKRDGLSASAVAAMRKVQAEQLAADMPRVVEQIRQTLVREARKP